MSTTPDIDAIAADIFESTSREMGFGGFDGGSAHSRPARDLVGEIRQSVAEKIAASLQLERDVAELDGPKRDLLPAAGRERLRSEAITEAAAIVENADARGKRAVEALRLQLRADALPKVDPARESLGREELSLLIGNGAPSELRSRVMTIAQRGSRDATAALFSDFGASLLEARGLGAFELNEVMDAARKIAANLATDRKAATVEEIVASKAYQRVDRLAAAVANAGATVRKLRGY